MMGCYDAGIDSSKEEEEATMIWLLWQELEFMSLLG